MTTIKEALERIAADDGCGCGSVCRCNSEDSLKIWKQEAQSLAASALADIEGAGKDWITDENIEKAAMAIYTVSGFANWQGQYPYIKKHWLNKGLAVLTALLPASQGIEREKDEALRRLANEVIGLGFAASQIIDVIGVTNWNVLQGRATDAKLLLDPVPEPTPAEPVLHSME